MSNLKKLIHNLYQDAISENEAVEASGNLLGFFRVLNEMHEEKIQSEKSTNSDVIESCTDTDVSTIQTI